MGTQNQGVYCRTALAAGEDGSKSRRRGLGSMRALSLALCSLGGVLARSSGCFGDVGAYVINVKVYADQDTLDGVENYIYKKEAMARRMRDSSVQVVESDKRSIQHLRDAIADKRIRHMENLPRPLEFADYKNALRKYIGRIFDDFNNQLLDSNVQIKADYSDLLAEGYENLKEKYCVQFANIETIAEAFKAEELNSEHSGINRLLMINCRGNNPIAPKAAATVVSQDGCGYIFGVLYTDPIVMEQTIKQQLLQFLSGHTPYQNTSPDEKLATSVCDLVEQCRHTPGFGRMYKDLRSVGPAEDLKAIGNNIADQDSYGYTQWLKSTLPPQPERMLPIPRSHM
ncbi:hypothetical protein PAPHI01_0899 [Pancytospora philotis]|nr:hypothetical protein PAPHI01_0899 [Pancytospora philotis]